MIKNKVYNMYDYIMEIREGIHMILDGIIAQFTPNKSFNINKSVNEYLYYVKDEPFYISPQFENVKIDRQLSSLNPKFMLFSAPGATGKSTLAKFMSYKLNAIYWNLAKIKLGSNSFSGTILKAIGNENYSNFVTALNKEETMLIIDALDEAEIISGRQMLGEFISDINEIVSVNGENPSVIILSRTETAQYIASYCVENNISLTHYEIGDFSENQAEEFIIKKAGLKTLADKECVNQYFSSIKNNISDVEQKTFLGYAPVLEAIATHIREVKNRQALLNELNETNNSVDIIMKILEDLLIREKSKVVDAMKLKCRDKYPQFNRWDCLYSVEEQLVRLINFILFNDKKYSLYEIDGLPTYIIDDYQAVLENFLEQHPFLRNSISSDESFGCTWGFAGPAFRDYTLSFVALVENYSEYAQLYFEEAREESYFPSQLFFDFYIKLNNDILYSKHISLLYESFRAKLTAYEHSYLYCAEENVEKGEYVVIFGTNGAVNTKKKDIPLGMIVNNDEISMSQLINVSLDVPKLKVSIKYNKGSSRICNSTIICKELELNVENLTIESYRPSNCLLVSENKVKGIPNTIDIVNGVDISIDIPNINDYYKFIPYKFTFKDSEDIDIKRVLYAMRCILIEFRTHKKDTMAKDAERIDNVTVGGNFLKKKVLEFFIDYGVIFKAGHLYKINIQKMQELEISYLTLMQANNEESNKAFEAFVEYCK